MLHISDTGGEGGRDGETTRGTVKEYRAI